LLQAPFSTSAILTQNSGNVRVPLLRQLGPYEPGNDVAVCSAITIEMTFRRLDPDLAPNVIEIGYSHGLVESTCLSVDLNAVSP
jgi:hypothetical protein